MAFVAHFSPSDRHRMSSPKPKKKKSAIWARLKFYRLIKDTCKVFLLLHKLLSQEGEFTFYNTPIPLGVDLSSLTAIMALVNFFLLCKCTFKSKPIVLRKFCGSITHYQTTKL